MLRSLNCRTALRTGTAFTIVLRVNSVSSGAVGGSRTDMTLPPHACARVIRTLVLRAKHRLQISRAISRRLELRLDRLISVAFMHAPANVARERCLAGSSVGLMRHARHRVGPLDARITWSYRAMACRRVLACRVAGFVLSGHGRARRTRNAAEHCHGSESCRPDR